ncbi:Holliday junction resolvase RuvX [Prochlorococcus sp. MIT 1307]|uniref:Holliday junction resolvase RuvX n=1 Tax=Prochlorococcus sp. MIT 1307 TaxID=3096219 RepID=UPI002A758EB5|nr:Holliday junction resolvase RuvX [Prochlorococcus sp. MIT 1307]
MRRPQPKSILSLDVGQKRIGLAGCDPLGISITSLPAIHRKTYVEDIKILKFYCDKRNVKGLIVGIPLDEKGNTTEQSKYCEKLANRIAKTLDLPMALINEHSSSWAASEKFNLKKDRSGKLDSAAAALLLEQWLREGPEVKPVRMPA